MRIELTKQLTIMSCIYCILLIILILYCTNLTTFAEKLIFLRRLMKKYYIWINSKFISNVNTCRVSVQLVRITRSLQHNVNKCKSVFLHVDNLFPVDENRLQQCCAAPHEQYCQQYVAILLSVSITKCSSTTLLRPVLINREHSYVFLAMYFVLTVSENKILYI